MPTINVSDMLNRLCALQREALLELSPSIVCEAFPRWFVKSEGMPYWINRVFTFSEEEGADDLGEEFGIYVYTVNSGLIVAHVTSDVAGESDDLLDFVTPQVIEYIDARQHLQSDSSAFASAMPYLRRISFVNGGYTTFPASVGGVAQAGAAFQWRCEFDKAIVQAYY